MKVPGSEERRPQLKTQLGTAILQEWLRKPKFSV